MAGKSEFDEQFYLSEYADVRKAVEAGVFPSGYVHYLVYGKAEGRKGSSQFQEVARASSHEADRNTFSYVSPLDLATKRGENPSVRVLIEGGNSVEERSRPGAAFYDDPDGTGLFSPLDAVTVPHAPMFTVTASHVRQVGYRTYLSDNGFLFNDQSLANEFGRERFVATLGGQTAFENEDTGLIPTGAPREFHLDTRQRPVQCLQGEVVSLCSHEPSNYGSFLVRVLPKIAGRRHHLQGRRVIGPLYNQSMRDLYEIVGIPAESIIQHDTNVIYYHDKVIIPSNRNENFLLDLETRAFYAGLRDRFGSRDRPRKIFVTRLGWSESYAANHRIMLNEEELAGRLIAEGFDLVRTHSMSAREQIEAFSSADLVVGAAGSAMFNTVFSHPGTKLIDIESEPHWVFGHQNLFGSCGLNYGIFAAKAIDQDWNVVHKPFVVNVDALLSRIASMQ